MELKTEEEETKQKEQKKQEQDEEEEQQEQHFHVLAVDDSVLDRKLLERLLKVSSYQVTCVDSVDKALEYLGLLNNLNCDSTASSSSTSSLPSSQEGLKVNLIMTDYCMPGMSGYDLLKRVKGSSWKDVPVVVMSSENVPSRISMCLEGGAEEFFLKPLQLSDLQKLQPYLLKSMENSCESMEEEEEEEGPNNESGESDQKKDSNSEGHKSKNGFIKRKAVCPEPPERRPKIKGLEVV